jgi:hypothetical protein
MSLPFIFATLAMSLTAAYLLYTGWLVVLKDVTKVAILCEIFSHSK